MLLATEQVPSLPLGPEQAELARLVQRFRVCWDVWPEYGLVGSERRQIGFSLELHGTAETPARCPKPGSTCTEQVSAALGQIAGHIVPEDEPLVTCRCISNQALHFTRGPRHRPEVILTIQTHHRQRVDDPVDEHQRRCLKHMELRLKALGALTWARTKGSV